MRWYDPSFVRSESVVIGNTLPVIRAVTLQPSGAKVGDQLVATVDGSDVIAVSAASHDRESYGKEQLSELLPLANSSPKFTSSAQGILTQGQFGYVASAVDPKNDPLTFALESALPDMTIKDEPRRNSA